NHHVFDGDVDVAFALAYLVGGWFFGIQQDTGVAFRRLDGEGTQSHVLGADNGDDRAQPAFRDVVRLRLGRSHARVRTATADDHVLASRDDDALAIAAGKNAYFAAFVGQRHDGLIDGGVMAALADGDDAAAAAALAGARERRAAVGCARRRTEVD